MTATTKKKHIKLYTMVRRSIWASRRFAALPDDLHRYLYMYLLTCPHQGGAGCFVANEAYILADLRKIGSDWTPQSYARCLAAIVQSGLILTDDVTGEILIVDWWKDNGPSNDDWLTGAQRQCEDIESQALRDAAQEALAACRETMFAARGLYSRPAVRPLGPTITARDRVQAVMSRTGGDA